ncbi:hypothetical protein [Flavobacterium algicola]|uniref:hypothetical protein n=1 Tax=Flavobacterium algicola TaxID=556529 RepID=UPI001EFE85F3|nr:hypothetical protein [Flavobacterium algicola]MCG9792446.1 hypothetical protein [Flavobacterium algicola]
MNNIDNKNDKQNTVENKSVQSTHVDYFPAHRSRRQTNAEIAEDGFAVRDGRHPDLPNPYIIPKSAKSNLTIGSLHDHFYF